jgi:hypothetical protein
VSCRLLLIGSGEAERAVRFHHPLYEVRAVGVDSTLVTPAVVGAMSATAAIAVNDLNLLAGPRVGHLHNAGAAGLHPMTYAMLSGTSTLTR